MRNMTENQQKHAIPGSEYLLSLTSIVGKPIKDLAGYVSKEFDIPVFHVSRVLFEDGTQVSMEGEHDTAYICADDKVPGLSDENLETLHDSYGEDPDEDDEDEDDEDEES